MIKGVILILKKLISHFLMEMFLAPLPMVYVSQLIRFARVCSNIDDFSNRNLGLTAKLLKQGYRYHKFRKKIFLILPQTLKVNC